MVGYNFNTEINKIFKNDRCSDIFELGQSLGMHRFFMLNITDDKAFDIRFTEMVSFMKRVDFMLSPEILVKLTDPNFLKKEKQKSIYKIRCLAFVYAFFSFGPEYVREFLEKFLFRTKDEESMEQILDMIEELKAVTVVDKTDYRGILKGIENLLGFNGHQFFLNICYYCSVLQTEKEIVGFIEYYSEHAKDIYYNYMFSLLNLDEVSSDEEDGN